MDRKITGIVLAGGKSSRMGTEKGFVVFKGKPLIAYSLEVLKNICDEIIVSANSDLYKVFGYKVLKDEFPDSGPMGGIYTCLKASKNESNIVLSCDIPFISIEFAEQLVSFAQDYDSVVPRHDEELFEPLCAVYNKSLLPVFKDFIVRKHFKIVDIFKKSKTKYLKTGKENGIDPVIFLNINTLKQLEESNQIAFEEYKVQK